MPGKFTDGYTKSAQKQKFIRHRDLKMKDSELRKEAKIQRLMCEGVCKHCREKLQWRFKFDKYKPLRNPSNCQNCKQKTVLKAYRTFCDKCASQKKVCAGCCKTLLPEDIINESEMNAEETTPASVFSFPNKIKESKKATKVDNDEGEEDEEEHDDDDEDDAEEAEETGEDANEDGEQNPDDEEEQEEETLDNKDIIDQMKGESNEIPTVTDEDINQLEENRVLAMDLAWDAKKFSNVANNKYNKNRPTGNESSSYF